MDRAQRVMLEQMKIWAQQMQLPVTKDFVALCAEGLKDEPFRFNQNDITGLYNKFEKNYESISPDRYHWTGADVAKDFGLKDAKIVNIKSDRVCRGCKKVLKAGTKSLTSTQKINGKRQRVWYCSTCANKLVGKAKSVSRQLMDNEEPDWDDGKSSNGY